MEKLAAVVSRGSRVALNYLVVCSIAILTHVSAFAAKNVTLAWDRSADPAVTGYKLYYGVASGVYTNQVTTGDTATGTVPNLVEGVTYYFAATSFNSTDPESDYSNEISYTVPVTGGGNVAPTLNTIGNVAISEDATAQTVNLAGIGSGSASENQTLVVTATSSNPGLIPTPTVTYTSPNTTGTLAFTPVANSNGTATITVTVNDGQAANNTLSRTFTVTVSPVNDGPTLNALNAVTVNEDATAQTVNLSGISSGMANEAQTLSVTATSSDPSVVPNPSVTYTSPNTTGSLSFTPVANANGTATITVTVNDGQAANNTVVRTFLVTVSPVNDAPTLNTPANVSLAENAAQQTVNLSGIGRGAANETDTLTVTATSSNPSLIPNPTVNYTSPNAAGSLNFTPVANMNGSATITVTVNDGQAQNNTVVRTFNVAVSDVNSAPTLDALSPVTLNEDAGAQTVNLTGIGTGSANESQTLTVTATSSSPSVIPNPVISYASPNAAGTLTFTPVANANGSATITVTVNDGQAANNTVVRTFNVTVTAVNDAPTLNALANVNINENAVAQTVNLSGIGSGAANETQTLTVTATSSNPSLIPNPTVNYASPNTTGSLSFTPATDANGTATITVTLNDNQAQNNTVVRTFTVTVNNVNNAPTLNTLNNVVLSEDAGGQTVNLSGIGTGAANESDTLTVTATSSNPSLVPNPSVAYASPSVTGTLNYTPVANANGTATITVTVNDGQAQNAIVTRTFTVTVNAVNDAPTLSPLANLNIAENAPLQTVDLSGISTGATNESQTLVVTATSSNPSLIPNPTVSYTSPNATGTLTFTPVTDGNGSATITVTINDGQAQNNTVVRTFTVTVNGVNNTPTLNALNNLTLTEGAAQQTVNLSGIGSGAANESQTLTVSAVSSDTAVIPNPTITYTSPGATGTLRFTPVTGASGTATVTVTVNDGQAQNNTFSRTFTVTVNAVNDVPTLNALSNLSIAENAALQTVNLSGISSGSASENQTLTVTATSGNPGLIPNPTVNYASPGATGTLSFTPVTDANGSAVITVTVNDGQAQNNTISRTFTVSVSGVNNAPTLDAVSNVTINEDAGLQTVNLSGITSGAANESQTLAVTATSSNPSLIPNPTVTYTSPNTTGSLKFTAATNTSGSATITVTVTDGQAQNNVVTRTFDVTVSPVNDAPTLNGLGDLNISANRPNDLSPGVPQVVSLTGISAGPGNESQTLTVTASSGNPALIPNPTISYTSPSTTGTLTFTPAANAVGTVPITVQVSDGQAQMSRTFNVNLSVNALTISAIPNQFTPQGVPTAALPFTINAGATPAASLVVTAVSSNKFLVPDSNIILGGSGYNRTIIVYPYVNKENRVGETEVTVWVRNGSISNSTKFVVDVHVPAVTPLAVSVNGQGTISPNYNAQLLKPGTAYRMTAVPSAGQEFVNWTGSVTSSSPTLNFTMASNMVLQANFVANPFYPIAGNYNGLFYENDEVRQHSSGNFSTYVDTRGYYSGVLQIGAYRYGFSGRLGFDCVATNTIARRYTNALNLVLRFGAGGQTNHVTGALDGGNFASVLSGNRLAFDYYHPAPYAGYYTMVLPGQAGDTNSPNGDGCGMVSVAANGYAYTWGVLGDGTAFAQAAYVSKEGNLPFYTPLYYAGGGSMLGWLNFTNQATDDINGTLSWIKPGMTWEATYKRGFTNQLEAAGSRFSLPADYRNRYILGVTNATMAFVGGNLATNFNNSIKLGSYSVVNNLSPNRLAMWFALNYGVFLGTVNEPGTTKYHSFYGTVLQKRNTAHGYLLTGNQTAKITITSADNPVTTLTSLTPVP